MKKYKSLKPYLLLWGTQSLSSLGSTMTGYALILWLYRQSGSALETAMLSICSYAPYVLVSIFAGALSDRWDKKRTMLACDTLAALCTLTVLGLAETNALKLGHLYLVNALSGLMNTVQQPAADVAVTLLTPREHFQRAGGLRSLSYSLNNMLSPALATGLYAFAGLRGVILFDLATFCVAFLSLLLLIDLPQGSGRGEEEPVLRSAQTGLRYLRRERGVLEFKDAMEGGLEKLRKASQGKKRTAVRNLRTLTGRTEDLGYLNPSAALFEDL